MTAIWRPIPETAGLNETAVLLRYSCTSDLLSIHLTDLSQVWAEELSKSEICERARSIECSIDPLEDDSQLEILLEKIDAALCGKDGTSLSVIADGPDHFKLDLISPLPTPLPHLKWSSRLGPGSREQVKSEVMVPLVCSTYMRKQQKDNLVTLLAAKDGLMSKMMDKIESLGVDLVSLFPQLGQGTMLKRKRNQREALAPNVPGLGPFNETTWRTKFDSTKHKGVDFRQMSGIAFQESNTEAVKGLLEELDTSVFTPLPELLTNKKPQRKVRREETKDDFQHQITPQKLRKKAARAQRTVGSDDETTDDEGTTSPTPKDRSVRSTNSKRSATTTPASTKKLGTISASKRKAAAAQKVDAAEMADDLRKSTELSPSLHRTGGRQVSPSIPSRQPSPPLRRASSTSTSSTSASASEAKKQPMAPPTIPVQKPKIGRIGTRRVNTPEITRAESTEQDRNVVSTEPVSTSQPRTPRKLGRIGGRRPSATQGDSQISPLKNTQTQQSGLSQVEEQEESQMREGDTVRAGSERPRTPTPESGMPEESQEEKVVRKRRELEREMSQVKTTPKKKRRF